MNTDSQNLYDQYLDRELSEQKQLEFEEQLLQHDEILKDFNAYVKARAVLVEEGDQRLKEEIAAIRATIPREEEKETRILGLRPMLAAASVILAFIIGFVVYQQLRLPTNETLYATYFDPDDVYAMQVNSSEEANQQFERAMSLYQIGELDEAIRILESFLENPGELDKKRIDQLHLYAGLIYLQNRELEYALTQFGQVARYNEGIINEGVFADWYTALTYLRMEESEKALEKLSNICVNEGYYSEEACELAGKID